MCVDANGVELGFVRNRIRSKSDSSEIGFVRNRVRSKLGSFEIGFLGIWIRLRRGWCADSSGYIHDAEGITTEKLAFIMHLKNEKRARIRYGDGDLRMGAIWRSYGADVAVGSDGGLLTWLAL